jgi:hypothetical protein
MNAYELKGKKHVQTALPLFPSVLELAVKYSNITSFFRYKNGNLLLAMEDLQLIAT